MRPDESQDPSPNYGSRPDQQRRAGSPQATGTVEEWCDVFRRAGFFGFEHEVYELLAEGWGSQPAFDPSGVRYAERGPSASALLCSELRPRRFRQRARRALAETKATLVHSPSASA